MPDLATLDSADLDVRDGLVDDVAALVEGGQKGMVLNLVADLRSADLADLLAHLPEEAAQQVVRWMPGEGTSEAVSPADFVALAQALAGKTAAPTAEGGV